MRYGQSFVAHCSCFILLSLIINLYQSMALRRLILDVLQACLRGDIKLIKWLLEHKVRMDIKQNSGHTPISAACYNGHMEVVEYLMNIDPTLYTKESMIAMQAAAGQKHTDIVQYLATFAMPLKSEDDFLQLSSTKPQTYTNGCSLCLKTTSTTSRLPCSRAAWIGSRPY